ncbi:hypothetical protein L6164_028497 [Bauhinia variegata]|uniref:Uncharacterized protein n=1 Tax=Bauhinia variegata TaxID=167791 RepID=A0ACB9L5U0_BAUVA|nr:hypothetical protein L6164_028497 [Bauhinia variegata]
MVPRFGLHLFLCLSTSILFVAESKCSKGCDLALASYYDGESSDNLTYIAQIMQSPVLSSEDDIVKFNKDTIPNEDSVPSFLRINVPFPCDCIGGEFLGHIFQYSLSFGETYTSIARGNFSKLTTVEWLEKFNSYSQTEIPDSGYINVTVNCSCGNEEVSKEYGLFITYPLRPGDNLESIAKDMKLDKGLLQRYNPGVNFSRGSGLVFIPGKDQNGSYVPLKPSTKGLSHRDIAGISVGVVAGIILLALCIYVGFYLRNKEHKGKQLSDDSKVLSAQDELSGNIETRSLELGGPVAPGATGISVIRVNKSVEFSYEELANATNNFNMANKIGQGGFGAVYYAELRGEKVAIKKMDIQASQQFLAELRVLTHVHHLNLVRLIGYCIENSLFLVYEYIENGNLSQHLHGSGREPLPWTTRVQIALDSATGLEYIHEHTKPVYIHRDIKPENILLDKNFQGKISDFGLAKLKEVGSSTLFTNRLVGTLGYLPLEYVQHGHVSPKLDVYAFGIVLYELISAKEATFRSSEFNEGLHGLVALFDRVLDQPNPREGLQKLVDPRLGESYPIDSVLKMAQLAQACTQADPQQRPSMKIVGVALMTLSSTTENVDVSSFYRNPTLANLMSGR